MENQTKKCKHCQSDIPKKAKVCPNCRRKQGGALKWVIIAFLGIGFIGAMGSSDEETKTTEQVASNTNPVKVEEAKTADTQNTEVVKSETVETQVVEEVDNEFTVGDVVETSDLKITLLSANEWQSDNQFVNPKDGHVFYRFEFEFENISDRDQYVNVGDIECYADGYAMDMSFYGDDVLSISTLSSGKKVKGSAYYEVANDAESIELEYKINYWTEDKVIFKIK